MGKISVNDHDGKKWDEFVLKDPDSCFFHLAGWRRSLERAFGLKAFYLTEKNDEGEIRGVLPLFLKKSFLEENSLRSVPIGPYGGILADSIDIKKRLLEKGIELTKELGCDYLELRHTKTTKLEIPELPLGNKGMYFTFIKELPGNKEDCLADMPRKARQATNKSIRMGLSYEEGIGLLDECYDIFAISQKHLGSPVMSRKWFRCLAEEFRDSIKISSVKLEGKTLCSLLSFSFRDTVLPFYQGDITSYTKYNPNNFLYLRFREESVEKGYKYFDFGRSRKDTGSYFFKINQGFRPEQLYYQYYLNKAKEVPNISPANTAFDIARNIWRHMPLSMTKLLGPTLFEQVMP